MIWPQSTRVAISRVRTGTLLRANYSGIGIPTEELGLGEV